jgi:hypothetical protein
MSGDSPDVSGAPVTVRLQLLGEDFEEDEWDRSTRQLQAELRQLDVEDVALAHVDDAAVGAKVVDPVSLGAIVVALSASGGVLVTLLETVRDWLGRHSLAHKVAVTIDGDTIELDHATADQQRDLVDAYVRRHVRETGV